VFAEVKKEIEEAFKAREKPRPKRLLRSEDRKPDEAPLLVNPRNAPGKASKSSASKSNASTLVFLGLLPDSNSQPLYDDAARPLVYFPGLLSPVGNHPYRLVLNAFPNQHLGLRLTRTRESPIKHKL